MLFFLSGVWLLALPSYIQLLRSSNEGGSYSSGFSSSWKIGPKHWQLTEALCEKARSQSRRLCCKTSQVQFSSLRIWKILPSGRPRSSSRLSASSHSRKKIYIKSSQNIAFLDGLRGLLAFNQYFSSSYSQEFLKGWNGERRSQWLVQLLITRII